MWLFDVGMNGNEEWLWSGDLRKEGKRRDRENTGEIYKMNNERKKRCTGLYDKRRNKDKLKGRAELRAWKFEKRLKKVKEKS